MCHQLQELLQPDLTVGRLRELVKEIADACAPGPHVFVLVLQPENFTEQHKTRLESVLERKNGTHLLYEPFEDAESATATKKNEASDVAPVTEVGIKTILGSSKGPNVLLLLVKPSDFTKTDREKVKGILNCLSPCTFKHAMVILTHNENINRCVDDLIEDCERRYYNMSEQNRDQLMENTEHIIYKNVSYLTFNKKKKPPLNLVVCGRTGAEKTSVVQSILGRGQFRSLKHEREVCGRWVSLVELPDLSGKPPNAVMEQCLRSISLLVLRESMPLSWFFAWILSLIKTRLS
ncbi:hypothetical protein WMY93_018083 [Mugilogobius chulae]|uniref:AIG1-type G domain-containing protein n=1 Tax=Mugilogobius chulae TaxID=88201 RepID=A0AAW0NV46_9GOBI